MIYNIYCLKSPSFEVFYYIVRTSLVAQMVKRLPTMLETQVQSLDQEDPLEKEMATHSSTLAWRIPWMEESGGLQPMGSQSRTSLSLSFSSKGFPSVARGEDPTCQCRRCWRGSFDPWVGKIPWRRAWQPPAGFLPGECHGQRNLVGYSPWGHKELDMTEAT